MSWDISDLDDIIDSRDIEKRIDELQDAKDDHESTVEELREKLKELEEADELDDDAITKASEAYDDAKNDYDEDDAEELKKLIEFKDDVNSSEWKDGLTFICDSHWVDYCRELVKDIGDMPREIPSYIEIDWDKTADNLQADYSTSELDGETYWYRNC